MHTNLFHQHTLSLLDCDVIVYMYMLTIVLLYILAFNCMSFCSCLSCVLCFVHVFVLFSLFFSTPFHLFKHVCWSFLIHFFIVSISTTLFTVRNNSHMCLHCLCVQSTCWCCPRSSIVIECHRMWCDVCCHVPWFINPSPLCYSQSFLVYFVSLITQDTISLQQIIIHPIFISVNPTHIRHQQ